MPVISDDKILLPFGLSEESNQLVYIDDAVQGKQCGCICPVCRTPLVAKKGEKRAHHFAHAQDNDCMYAAESALHLAAKDLLKETGYIFVPDYVVHMKDKVCGRYETETVLTSEKVVNNKKIEFDDVRIEHRFHDIVPDILVNVGGYELIIEIFVSHKVDKEKLGKIRKLNTSALEIKINNFFDVRNRQAFKKTIIDAIDNKKWLFHPRQIKAENKHKCKVQEVELRIKENTRRKNDHRLRQNNMLNRSYSGGYQKPYNINEFDWLVEKEGNRFFKKNGRWPNNEETELIIRKFKR